MNHYKKFPLTKHNSNIKIERTYSMHVPKKKFRAFFAVKRFFCNAYLDFTLLILRYANKIYFIAHSGRIIFWTNFGSFLSRHCSCKHLASYKKGHTKIVLDCSLSGSQKSWENVRNVCQRFFRKILNHVLGEFTRI